MKKAFTLIAIACFVLLAASCTKKEYTINGTFSIDDYENCTLYLYDAGSLADDPLDSATITNGSFSFAGHCKSTKLCILYTDNGFTAFKMPIILEAGNITIDGVAHSITGTALNETLSDYLHASKQFDFDEELTELMAERQDGDTARQIEIYALYDSIANVIKANSKVAAEELYNNHHDDILGVFAFQELIQYSDYSYPKLDSLYKAASPLVTNFKVIGDELKMLENVYKTSTGNHFTDIEGIIFETGKMGKLSDIINGKVAIVDFWASWCSPCRKEISTNLVKLYDKYASKGLVIVGVDVWDGIDAHKAAVESLNIKYPQLIDTTMTATQTYGINGIPQIMLIGADGKIVARDLRDEEIEKAIIKVLEQ